LGMRRSERRLRSSSSGCGRPHDAPCSCLITRWSGVFPTYVRLSVPSHHR
jgi:hypothetical protein